jgi:predicted small lipoprotein YifL
MNKSLAFAAAALLAVVLSGCGNKGDLVRPVPSTSPPPTAAPETPVPSTDAPATSAQDPNGH